MIKFQFRMSGWQPSINFSVLSYQTRIEKNLTVTSHPVYCHYFQKNTALEETCAKVKQHLEAQAHSTSESRKLTADFEAKIAEAAVKNTNLQALLDEAKSENTVLQ